MQATTHYFVKRFSIALPKFCARHLLVKITEFKKNPDPQDCFLHSFVLDRWSPACTRAWRPWSWTTWRRRLPPPWPPIIRTTPRLPPGMYRYHLPDLLRTHDILGWIRIRIRGSMPRTNGFGSCYFRHWPSRDANKKQIFKKVFLVITFWRYRYMYRTPFSKIKI